MEEVAEEKKKRKTWTPFGRKMQDIRKEKVPAGAAGGQRPAGIATEYIIYFADLAGFFLL